MGFGGLRESTEKVRNIENAPAEETEEKRRKVFHYWTVGEREYRLKLTTGMIEKLENKYHSSVLTLVLTNSGIPPLSVMLTVIQAALSPWEHEITYDKTKKLYDRWIEEGGNQMSLYTDVLIPTLTVSGFFSEKQNEEILAGLQGIQE